MIDFLKHSPLLNDQFLILCSLTHFVFDVIVCLRSSASGGAGAIILKDAITRAPCLRLPSAMRAAAGDSLPFYYSRI